MTVGKKIAFGFGVVLVLLVIVSVLSLRGVSGMGEGAVDVISKMVINIFFILIDNSPIMFIKKIFLKPFSSFRFFFFLFSLSSVASVAKITFYPAQQE